MTGCWEPPHTNPMDGMSEEQKEYEAVQLANLMAKLTKYGIVQNISISVLLTEFSVVTVYLPL